MFSALVQKDFRSGLSFWLFILAIVAASGIAMVVALAVAPSTRMADGFLLLVVCGLTAHILLLPVHTYRLLQTEWRTGAPLWLSVPGTGWVLLASKILVAFVYTATSWMLAAGFAYGLVVTDRLGVATIMQKTGVVSSTGSDVVRTITSALHVHLQGLFLPYALYGSVMVLGLGVYIAVWVILASMATHATWRRFPRGRKVVALAVVVVALWGVPRIALIPGYRTLVSLGSVTLPKIPALVYHAPISAPFAGLLGTYGLVALAVLAVSVYILDRRVEV